MILYNEGLELIRSESAELADVRNLVFILYPQSSLSLSKTPIFETNRKPNLRDFIKAAIAGVCD